MNFSCLFCRLIQPGPQHANCRDTCTAAARQEWGFDGVIMTDWTTTEHGEDCTASGCMRAGNDLVMPGQFSDHDHNGHRAGFPDGDLEAFQVDLCGFYRFVSQ